MKFILALMLTVAADGPVWHVMWDANSDQTAVVAVTECKNNQKFYVFDRQPLVDIGQDTVDMRRQRTPPGERCTVRFTLMVAIGDDGSEAIVPDQSTIVTQED